MSDDQVEYLGKWIEKKHFRAYIYNASDKKLTNSWDEYKQLIGTGLWFATQEEALPREPVPIKLGRKPKNGADS